jgi:hypothetical protein
MGLKEALEKFTKPVGRLRATIVMEWDVDSLEHYNAKTMKQAAKLTQDQLNTGDLGLYDLNEFGDMVMATVKAIPMKEKKRARAGEG